MKVKVPCQNKVKIRAYMLPKKDEHRWVRKVNQIAIFCDHCYLEYKGLKALQELGMI